MLVTEESYASYTVINGIVDAKMLRWIKPKLDNVWTLTHWKQHIKHNK